MVAQVVEVIGPGGFSAQLAQALAAIGVPAETGGRPAIVCDWDDLDALHRLDDDTSFSWILIEDGGEGRIVLGPQFGADAAGCFSCYAARRVANGAPHCQPVSTEVPVEIVREVARELGAFVDGRTIQAGTQIEFFPDGTAVRHHFLPLPTCQRCRPKFSRLKLPDLNALVSARVGLVTRVSDSADALDGIKAVRASGSSTNGFIGRRALNQGMAADVIPERAFIRAVGESVERYCAAFYPEDLPLAQAGELDGPWLDPNRLAPGIGSFTPEMRIRWTRARVLANGDDVWVPASFVYIPYYGAPGEPSFDVQSTTGLALGRDIDEAIEHALAEVVERDAFMRAWRFDLPVERVILEPIHLAGLHLCRIPSESGFEIVVGFIERPEPPYTAVGLAARRSLAEAASAAAIEAAAAHIWLREWLATDPDPPAYPPRTLYDHARVHAIRRDLSTSRQRWLSATQVAVARPELTHWRQISARFADACIVELTPPDVAATGACAVRVIVPDCVPLDHDAIHPRLVGNATPHPLA